MKGTYWKKIRHFEHTRHLHELTFSCYRRMPLLTNDCWRQVLARSLSTACLEESFALIAFVFMPEHVHLLVLPLCSGSRVSRLLARTKQPTSKQIRQLLEDGNSRLVQQLTVRERPGKSCIRFWQEGPGFDRNIFSPTAITSSINYIHMNPVKRNLCRAAVDFKWSSARFHHCDTVDADLPILQKPDPEWFYAAGVTFDSS